MYGSDKCDIFHRQQGKAINRSHIFFHNLEMKPLFTSSFITFRSILMLLFLFPKNCEMALQCRRYNAINTAQKKEKKIALHFASHTSNKNTVRVLYAIRICTILPHQRLRTIFPTVNSSLILYSFHIFNLFYAIRINMWKS
jgi:hypothetical protein